MGHRALKGAVCHRPSILGMFRIENKIGYYRRLKSAVFNSDIKKDNPSQLSLQAPNKQKTTLKTF